VLPKGEEGRSQEKWMNRVAGPLPEWEIAGAPTCRELRTGWSGQWMGR
jgi:hypothetical protein